MPTINKKHVLAQLNGEIKTVAISGNGGIRATIRRKETGEKLVTAIGTDETSAIDAVLAAAVEEHGIQGGPVTEQDRAVDRIAALERRVDNLEKKLTGTPAPAKAKKTKDEPPVDPAAEANASNN